MRYHPIVYLLPALSLAGCGGDGVIYKPAAQILPAHIRKIAIRPVVNKTQAMGLEDKLLLSIRDELLRNGQYQITPEADSDGVLVVTITRYILIPTQYDSVLTPTAYKLRVLTNLQFIDRTENKILWTEHNLEGVQRYAASTISGGITEEEAREKIWDRLARIFVKRTVEGFGSVTGTSWRSISGEAPPDQPAPAMPYKPVNPNPY